MNALIIGHSCEFICCEPQAGVYPNEAPLKDSTFKVGSWPCVLLLLRQND